MAARRGKYVPKKRMPSGKWKEHSPELVRKYIKLFWKLNPGWEKATYIVAGIEVIA
jgi:hypothetical protein